MDLLVNLPVICSASSFKPLRMERLLNTVRLVNMMSLNPTFRNGWRNDMFTAITLWIASTKIDYDNNITPMVLATFSCMCSIVIDISLAKIAISVAF